MEHHVDMIDGILGTGMSRGLEVVGRDWIERGTLEDEVGV